LRTGRFKERVLPLPEQGTPDTWSALPLRAPSAALVAHIDKGVDAANRRPHREPVLPGRPCSILTTASGCETTNAPPDERSRIR
jgi:hypothetical protein